MTTDETINASAKRAGALAAREGLGYNANPFGEDRPAMRLAWSEGHNEARAAKAQRREVAQMRGQR